MTSYIVMVFFFLFVKEYFCIVFYAQKNSFPSLVDLNQLCIVFTLFYLIRQQIEVMTKNRN